MPRRIASSAAALGLLAAAPAAFAAPVGTAPPAPPPKVSAATVKAFAALPDWTGVWQGTGTLFDQSHGSKDANAGHVRDYPPYKPDWEARYDKFLKDVVWQDKFVDPITLCYPPGFPRLASVPFGIQFVVRPEETWIVYERNPVRFIFTDGRPHPSGGDLWPTWEGHSIGHWEGDTLVVDTIGLKNGVVIDRTGLVLSDQAHVSERIRRVSLNQMEDVLTIDDPGALTKPWVVRRVYNRQTETFAPVANIACAESQRNAIVGGQNSVTLGTEKGAESTLYPPDIMPYSVPYGAKP